MGYSGNASFVYEVERYLNKTTSKLMLEDEALAESAAHPFGDEWFDINYEYQNIPLNVVGTAYYKEGKSYGAPENCYPDEGDVEITSITDNKGTDWQDKLTVSETDQVTEMIQEHVVDESADCYEEDDYYDDGDCY